MKKLTLLFVAVMAWIAFTASAEAVKVGNLYYEILDETAKTAEIVAPPTGTPYQNVQNGWFAKSVTINGETYTVETVGEGAFEGASFSPYANSSGVATFYMIAVPLKVIKKDAFKDITARSDGNVGIRFTTNVCTANVTGSSMLTQVDPGAFRGAHIRGFVATGGSGGYSHTTAFSNGATGLYNTNTNTIICAPADMRADASMGTGGQYGGYATTATFNSAALEVADYAFWGNTHLKTITMNEGLTTIGQQAFHGMTALQTVNIPSTVTSLATDAFEGCTAIANLTCNVATPPAGVVFEDDVYDRIRESGNITVPEGSLAAYQADPDWKKFWTAPVEAPKMFIAGTFTNWADGKLEMTENDGVYTITVNGIQQGDKFKFIEGEGESAVWYGGNAEGATYGVHPDWCTNIALSNTGQDFEITSGNGNLTFTIDANKNLTITGWAAPANELYLAGSMTNWATDKEAMTLDDQTGKFSITRQMDAGAEFKFIDQNGTWIGGDASGTFVVQRDQVVNATELTLLLNGGNNFQIPIAGTWTLTVDKQTMKLVITGEWPAPKYAVTVASGIQNGTVEADKAEAEEGEAVTLTVTPATGYALATLTYTVEGQEPEAIENNTFNMPAADVTINATFAPVDYTITVAAGIENGTVEAPAAANYGETVTLTVTPAEGYQLKNITVTPETLDLEVIVDANNQFEMPADNVTVTAEFEEIPPVESVITFVAEMEHATVEVSVAGEPIESGALVAEGTEVTITVAPENGYYVENISVVTMDTTEPEGPAGMPRRANVDVTPGDNNTYTFNMPAEPININVSIAQQITTGIYDLNVNGNKGVKYVNPMGQVSDRPFEGINIVIDGNKTYKVIK